LNSEKKERRVIGVFAAASFLNDFGSDVIYPLWPLFVTVFMGADMVILGLVDGLGDAIVSISQAVSGYLSDRLNRRRIFIWSGYIFGAASRVGYALSRTWHWLVPFRVLDRSGKMRGAPRDAMVADASTEANRGSNFGLLRAMDNLGAVCGIVTSIMLFPLLGYKALFLLAAVPSLLSASLVLTLIRERKTTRIYRGLSLMDLDANFMLFLLLSSVFAVGNFSYSFLLVYAKSLGYEETLVPVLYLLFTVVASLMSLPFGRAADRLGRKPILALAYGLFALMCLGFSYANSMSIALVLFVLYGLHRAAIEPVQKTLVSELSPARYRASTLGAFQMITGLASLPASIIAGLLWESIGPWAPFTLSLLLTASSLALLTLVREKNRA